MNDIQYLLEKLGLCWHKWGDSLKHPLLWECSKCKETRGVNNRYQLDPLSSADMFDTIWPALEKSEDYIPFIDWLNRKSNFPFGLKGTLELATKAPRLYKALLTFFREREDADS